MKLFIKYAPLNSDFMCIIILILLFINLQHKQRFFSPEQTRVDRKSLESSIDFPSHVFISIFQVWLVGSLALLEFNVGVCHRLLQFIQFYLSIVCLPCDVGF